MEGTNGGTNYTLNATFVGSADPDDTFEEAALRPSNKISIGGFADFSANPHNDVDLCNSMYSRQHS